MKTQQQRTPSGLRELGRQSFWDRIEAGIARDRSVALPPLRQNGPIRPEHVEEFARGRGYACERTQTGGFRIGRGVAAK